MRFQERDGWILSTLDDYGGVLARRHLQDLFWPEASLRAMLARLALLVEQEYLARPTRYHWRTEPIPEAVYWIGWRGALWLAEQRSISVDPPKNSGENQMRLFHRNLREHGMRWVREPKWDRLRHDLVGVDFRLLVERSVNELASISMEQWVVESEFRANMDRVEYTLEGKGKVEWGERGVCPDGFFVIADEERMERGDPHRLPCLLEIDMATHDNPSFGRDKAAPYAAYVKSPAFKTRFGLQAGIWLIVTTGTRRMQNLMRQTALVVGQDTEYFFFTHFNELKGASNVLTDPIWFQVGKTEPRSLL